MLISKLLRRSFVVLFISLCSCQDEDYSSTNTQNNNLNINEASTPVAPSADWEPSIQAFEKQDLTIVNATENLFVGSSTIRIWDTSSNFNSYNTLNRGFGGSQLVDIRYYIDRVVTKHQPNAIFIYSGDNDIAAGKSPDVVLADFRGVVSDIRTRLPNTKIHFIAIKPSLARWALETKFVAANKKIKQYVEQDGKIVFIDIHDKFLDASGKPDSTLYLNDNLHLSSQGYQILNNAVRPYLYNSN